MCYFLRSLQMHMQRIVIGNKQGVTVELDRKKTYTVREEEEEGKEKKHKNIIIERIK